MSLSRAAIRYQPIVVTIVLLLMVWGTVSFFTMPRREDPEFTIRVCVVSTSWPGTPAEKVEELVTDKLEEALDSIEEVDLVRSKTITGQSTIFVELEDRLPPADIQNVWDKVRARVELVPMPEPGIRPIVNDEFGDTAILVLAVHQVPVHGRQAVRDDDDPLRNDRYSMRELEVFADRVRDSLRLLPGVAKVDKFGVRDEAIYIETDLGTWSQLEISTSQLQQLVAGRNIVEPGGDIDTPVGRYSVRPGGEFNAVDEIEGIIADAVQSDGSPSHVYLRDLGLTVHRSYEDPPQYICRYGDVNSSEPCVCLALTMKSGANIVDICTAAKDHLQQLVEVDQILPADIAVTPVSDQSENVSAKIRDVVINVAEAVLIVVIVVYLVVGFRTSLVMAANIPIVVMASIGVITTFGVQLEQISLASIIISLGLLVDNAVQVCDQSRTNQMAGMNPVDGTASGATTLSTPMLVGTLTTVAAFLPMLFALEGGGKEYVYSLPVTLSITLGLSWILAMTFCVILASSYIRAPRDPGRPSSPVLLAVGALREWFRRRRGKAAVSRESDSENFVYAIYGVLGGVAVRRKWVTLAVAVACLGWAISLPVSSEFFPQDRRDQFAVKIWLPETATIAQTDQKAREVEHIIRQLSSTTNEEGASVERLRAMRTMVGGGGSRWHLSWDPEAPAANFAEILVRTTDGRLTPEYVREIRRVAERGDVDLQIEPVVGARVIPVELMLGPPADPLVLRIVGNGFADFKTLRSVTNSVKQIVREQPEAWDIHDSWGVPGYQLNVNIDQDKANLVGVTNSKVAQSLNSYFSGLYLTTFREGDHQVPVYFRLTPEERGSIKGLQTAYVEGIEGYSKKVPLDSIASFETRWEPARIERRDLNRVIEVRSRIEAGIAGNDIVQRVLDSEQMKSLQQQLPAGFVIEPGGAFEESLDSRVQMLTSFAMSFFLIVLCLVFQYNGWSKPLIVLATLPLALIGALPGLYVTGNSIGFMPQLGILSLFGIVLNTGIIFIEFADLLIKERIERGAVGGPIMGLTRDEFRECLVAAGKQRMLPIFLTTATTVGGLIPLALSGGPLWEGLAWCMIFGLIVATLLTLFVIPALYAIFVETFGVQPLAATEQPPVPVEQ